MLATGCSGAKSPETPNTEPRGAESLRDDAAQAVGTSAASTADGSASGIEEEAVAREAVAHDEPAPEMDSEAPEEAPLAAPAAPPSAASPAGKGDLASSAVGRVASKAAADAARAKRGATRSKTGVSATMAESKDRLGGMGGGAGPARARIARSEASVRAGEWDDNANFREFRRYLASESHLPFRPLDLSSRRFLVVRDVNGKGVVNCPVVVRDASQHEVRLTTTASGRALLFPRAEGLVGDVLDVTASCSGGMAHARVNTFAEDAVVDLKLDSARTEPTATMDLVFVLDTTGSMSEEIDAVKDTISKVAREVGGKQTAMRVALVEYRDKGDAFVTRIHDFETNLDAFSHRIQSLQAGGGGDTPEHANEGLRVAIDHLAWNPAASARLAFLIGDAPPHLDYADDPGYERSLHRAASRGIQLYTVAASGMNDLGQVVWRQAAQYTGATNMFVLRGGAGPQSTGAGDPKSSCGGTQTNFSSGNLDQLIVGKVELTRRLLDLDPMRIAGLGQDESAKPCAERLVLAR